MDKNVYQAYIDILKEELVPAMGCTEPVAVAYAGALARETLGKLPTRTVLTVSGNIVKNVKSVIVPHTGGRKGLKAAVAAGILYGKADRELEVLAEAVPEEIALLETEVEGLGIELERADSDHPFDLAVRAEAGEDYAYIRILDHHTNLVLVEKNGEILQQQPYTEQIGVPENRALLNVKDIVTFAEEVRIEDIKEVLGRQIEYNIAIAEEGLGGGWGARIGKTLLESYVDTVNNRAKAWAAAGSDARMSGCELPVVINSHSGNQGITASVPVIIYARDMGATEEELYRALAVSNLITIHLKTGIGSLSAYCGATSAGAGAGAGICFLHGGRYIEVAHTVVNAIAINSGMICDGAKPSCAAKIASAVEAGLLGWQMYNHDNEFHGGDGIVIKGVENTIRAVSRIAREGMRSTDKEIIALMLEENQ